MVSNDRAETVSVDISLTPIGAGTSLTKYIALCENVLLQSGLHPTVHAHGTNVDGEWSKVLNAIAECHNRLHEEGVERVSSTVKFESRKDGQQRTPAEKVEKVVKEIVNDR